MAGSVRFQNKSRGNNGRFTKKYVAAKLLNSDAEHTLL